MTQFRQVRQKPEIVIERLDGGLNTRDSPSKIDDTESPDSLNVDYGDRGSVKTREGTSYFNPDAMASAPGLGLTTYQNKMIAWRGGNMYYASNTTMVPITAASGLFSTSSSVAYVQYQNILFCSDGTNGPYRYEGSQSFYNMGIGVPSAPTGFSNVAGANLVPTGTHFYAVSFVNSHAVEGEVGSASVGVTLATSASVAVTGIAVGSALQGVFSRKIYRSTSNTGPWGLVTTVAGNVTTSFTDVASVTGATSVTESTSPKPFSAIRLHAERLWMDDNDDPSLCRYTEYTNPFVSKDLNFLLMSEGGERQDIKGIGVQNDLVTCFKDGEAIYVVQIGDPSDDTTFAVIKSPANVGISGPKAMIEDDNGILFVAKRKGQLVGFGYISGVDLVESDTPYLKNKMISRKIESILLQYPAATWPDISMFNYKNRIYIGTPKASNSTIIDGLTLFDVNRIVQDKDTDPGSWSIWEGDIGCNDFTNFNNILYGITSASDGKILRFNNGTFTDASGAAIDSYYWGKEFGGEGDLESWVKDIRHVLPWIERLGTYDMQVCIRLDGEGGSGMCFAVDLTPAGALWNVGTWNTSEWGPGSQRDEEEIPVGPMLAKRIQVGFHNEQTVGQGFEVHNYKIRFNMRRQR